MYENASRQMILDLHSRANNLTQIRAERRDREDGIESGGLGSGVGPPHSVVGQKNEYAIGTGLAAPMVEESVEASQQCVSDVGLTATQPKLVLSHFLWPASQHHAPRCIRFPSLKSEGVANKLLGRGAHGFVIKGYDAHTLEDFALKIADVRGESIVDVADAIAVNQREYDMLRKCTHPNIMNVLAQLHNPDSRQTALLLELADSSLHGFLHRRSEVAFVAPTHHGRVAAVMQIFRGMAHMHHRDVLHCDIKPANILMRFGSGDRARMEGSRMMIADFGMARTKAEARKGDMRADRVSTFAYRAPELIQKGETRVGFGAEIDVWSACATAYDCASWGNPQGPKIYMLQFYLEQGAKRVIDMMVARNVALKRLASDDSVLRIFLEECARWPARRPSADLCLHNLTNGCKDMVDKLDA